VVVIVAGTGIKPAWEAVVHVLAWTGRGHWVGRAWKNEEEMLSPRRWFLRVGWKEGGVLSKGCRCSVS
jgi:hypothetical protein